MATLTLNDMLNKKSYVLEILLLCSNLATNARVVFKLCSMLITTLKELQNSCVVYVLFNTALCRSAFSSVSFRKLVFRLSVPSLNKGIKTGVIYVVLFSHYIKTYLL